MSDVPFSYSGTFPVKSPVREGPSVTMIDSLIPLTRLHHQKYVSRTAAHTEGQSCEPVGCACVGVRALALKNPYHIPALRIWR